jgi:iron complex outermembrane receptor protein
MNYIKIDISVKFWRICLCGLLISASAQAQDAFWDLDLKEVLDLEITSVSKKPQTMSKAAAAVFVITGEDIRRMGAQTIPDALRMAPGVQVAQVSANAWAITARGPNSRFANKLLVLVDGRSVYSPLFSGVFWDVQDTVLADVERIEVIRGPGASLWGANAVNGVINIITKSAAATQGGLLQASTGTQERASAALRYGGKLEGLGHWRLYAKGFDRAGLDLKSTGAEGSDSWRQQRFGARADLNLGPQDALALQGEVYQGQHGESAVLQNRNQDPFYALAPISQQVSGGHLLMRWQRELPESNTLTVQSYLDRTVRDWPAHPNQTLDTFDADVQYRHRAFKGHDLVMGLSYRVNHDRITPSTTGIPQDTLQLAQFSNASLNTSMWSALLQDDITLLPDELILTLGAKLEKFDSNQPKTLPNTRLLWTPREDHTVWAAVSKALRTPSRLDRDGTIRSLLPRAFEFNGQRLPLPTIVEISGQMDPESLWAYELGWKHRWAPGLTTDITAYINDYTDLRSVYAQSAVYQPGDYLLLPMQLSNKTSGRSQGLEVWADWQASRQHRLQASLTRFGMEIQSSNPDVYSFEAPSSSPQWSGSLRWSYTPRPDLELDLAYRQAASVSNQLFGHYAAAYKTVDMRWAWRSSPKVQWQLVGRNLLTARHQEFSSEAGDTAEALVGPSVSLGVSLQF